MCAPGLPGRGISDGGSTRWSNTAEERVNPCFEFVDQLQDLFVAPFQEFQELQLLLNAQAFPWHR